MARTARVNRGMRKRYDRARSVLNPTTFGGISFSYLRADRTRQDGRDDFLDSRSRKQAAGSEPR